MEKYTIKDMTKMAVMAAIVFILTYTFKIPFADGRSVVKELGKMTP